MRELVLTPRFKRAFRKFMRQHRHLQKTIEETLVQMQNDVFAASLHTHKLTGPLFGLRPVLAVMIVVWCLALNSTN